MKKRSLDSIVWRLLDIYWQRARRYREDGMPYIAAAWRGKHEGMAILYERVNLEGK